MSVVASDHFVNSFVNTGTRHSESYGDVGYRMPLREQINNCSIFPNELAVFTIRLEVMLFGQLKLIRELDEWRLPIFASEQFSTPSADGGIEVTVDIDRSTFQSLPERNHDALDGVVVFECARQPTSRIGQRQVQLGTTHSTPPILPRRRGGWTRCEDRRGTSSGR